MKKLTHIGLFAGCGGLDLGIEQAGFKTVALLDFWDPAIETLQKNFKNPIIEKMDITKMVDPKGDIQSWIDEYNNKNSDSVEKIDLIAGGPPCQPFSRLNQNQLFKNGKFNSKDPRISLSEHFFRVVNDVRPRFFIFENVPDLKKRKNKDGSKILDSLLKLVEGYGYKTLFNGVLNASDFGVSQGRKRYIIVGALEEEKIEQLSFDDCYEKAKTIEKLLDNIEKSRKKGEKIENDEGHDEEKCLEFSLPGTEEKINRIDYIQAGKFHNHLPVNAKAHDVVDIEDTFEDQEEVMFKILKDNHYIVCVNTGEVYARSENEKYIVDGKTKDTTIFGESVDLENGTYCAFRTKDRMGTYLRRLSSEISVTVTRNPLLHPHKNRELTSREIASIQSFPMDYEFHKKKLSRQLGNAVPPRLAKKIALQLLKNDQKRTT